MDVDRESSISQAKDSQIEDSWIPATKTQPTTCTENQETQPSKEPTYLLEFKKFLLEENEAREANIRLELEQFFSSESYEEEAEEEQVAFWGSTNSDDGGNNREFKEIPTHLEQILHNMPFNDLLNMVDNESELPSNFGLQQNAIMNDPAKRSSNEHDDDDAMEEEQAEAAQPDPPTEGTGTVASDHHTHLLEQIVKSQTDLMTRMEQFELNINRRLTTSHQLYNNSYDAVMRLEGKVECLTAADQGDEDVSAEDGSSTAHASDDL